MVVGINLAAAVDFGAFCTATEHLVDVKGELWYMTLRMHACICMGVCGMKVTY